MHRPPTLRSRPVLRIAFVAVAHLLLAGIAHGEEAEIVSLIGRGEAKETAQAEWRLAAIRQRLHGGAFVRTGDLSQMALLLDDQTQLRLNQNSLLQIKDVAAQGTPTRLELRVGRAWMQAKGQGPGAGAQPRAPGAAAGAATVTGAAPGVARAAPVPAVVVETPNATAAIRGTDWELAVDERGVALLTVLSGEVEFFNDLGRVVVRPNEQARAEPGKAPVKILLTNARDRVQWVTAYRAQPARWARARSPELDAAIDAIAARRPAEAMSRLAAAPVQSADVVLVRTDLLLAQGAVDEAISLLEAQFPRFASDGRFAALLARAYLIADRGPDAARVLEAARSSNAGEVEVWIASGDLARFDGDERAAIAAYRQALALGGETSETAAAWFGLGVVATEREDVRRARSALGEALRLDPAGPGFLGELGTLETFADDFDAARKAFDAALAEHPDDYVALTGLGVMQLKRGDPEAALQSLLKAGVIEPRYARAALYTAVAYYQLGRRERAIETFRRAADLDPKDPLPWLMLSMVSYDALDWGDAVDTSRAAVERMPYLRSLNQLLMNQKGYAGIGSAVAAFGLEEWAQAYAYDAYTPYWAGSHLFLADRFDGLFNKNSELYQGFLTDPTVFGASNRFNTLVPRPGDYVTLVGTLARQDFKGAEAQAAFNGYHNEQFPFAYYASVDGFLLRPRGGEGIDGSNGIGTIGLGARPTHDVGLFLFGNRTRGDVTLTDTPLGFPGNPVTTDSTRIDGGFNFRFAPDSQSWFKAGWGRDTANLGGAVLLPGDGETIPADITAFESVTRAEDFQWRHTIDLSPGWQLSAGAEYGRQKKPFAITFTGTSGIGAGEQEETTLESTQVYMSNRLRPADGLLLQADLFWQKVKKRFQREDFLAFPGSDPLVYDTTTDDRDFDGINGAVGAAWRIRSGLTLRAAWQRWRRPASVATLGPVDTAGIPFDDRLVAAGGRLERTRAQLEWEADALTFWQAFADWRRVVNLPSPKGVMVPDFGLTDLERLRNLIQINLSRADYYEGDPEFGAGRSNAAGLAVNRIVTKTLSASLRYVYNDANDTTEAYAGNRLPFSPQHTVQVGATWVALPRLQVSGVATYRTVRYRDEANTDRLGPGWNFGVGAYWETEDKRWAFGAAAENLLSNQAAGKPHEPLVGVQVIWRQ